MSTIGYINVSLETFGGILSLVFILCLRAVPSMGIALERSYTRMLYCNTILLFSDAAAWLFKGRPDVVSYWMVRIANFCVFVLGYVMLVLFTLYLINFLALKNIKIAKWYVYLFCTLMVVAVLLVCVSQINHMYYEIDADNIYRRHPWFWLSQAFGMTAMMMNGGMLYRYRKNMGRRERITFTVYIILPVAALVFQMLFYNIAVLYLATTVCLICVYVGIQMELLDKISQKELAIEKKNAAVMLSQMRPHFLYNSLTAIKALCDMDAQAASEALEHFAYYLRRNLDSISDSRLIPFGKELEHVQDYLYLEKMRLGEKLNIEMKIHASEFKLPPLTLQPLAENAVKHGIAKSKSSGTLVIETEQTLKEIIITISDDGVGFDMNQPADPGRTHIGIENVRKRIELQCSGYMTIHSQKGAGTIVKIMIPCTVRSDSPI